MMKNTLSAFILFFFIFLYSLLTISNDSITDSRNYYYFYQTIEEYGLLYFLNELYTRTKKIEATLYLIYSLYSSFAENIDFNKFVYLNYSLFTIITIITARTYDNKKSKFFIFLILFSWFPTYSNILWTWRSNISFVLLVMAFFIYTKKNKVTLPYILTISISTLTHWASLPIFLIFITFYSCFKNKNITLPIIYSVLSGIIAGFFYDFLKSILSSGEASWSNDHFAGFVMLIYFIILNILLIYLTERDKKNLTGYYCFNFFCISICLSINPTHLDITRIMSFSYFLYCFLFIEIISSTKNKFRILIYLYTIIGVIPTLYSMFNFLVKGELI